MLTSIDSNDNKINQTQNNDYDNKKIDLSKQYLNNNKNNLINTNDKVLKKNDLNK